MTCQDMINGTTLAVHIKKADSYYNIIILENKYLANYRH